MGTEQVSGPHDFSDITEVPGAGATRDQLARLLSRYQTARGYATANRVLEIACGGGMGLGYLGGTARQVVGGDYTGALVQVAKQHYANRFPLLQLDGQHLPFADRSFDLVLIFEALYYMQDQARVFRETRRVLDRSGVLVISTVNKDWSGFSPSRSSTQYRSVPELRQMLSDEGFGRVEFYGAFPAAPATLTGTAIALLRRTAAALNLVPMTLGGRAALKRLFYGPLVPLPPEVHDQLAPPEPLVALRPDAPVPGFKIIYAVAHIDAQQSRTETDSR